MPSLLLKDKSTVKIQLKAELPRLLTGTWRFGQLCVFYGEYAYALFQATGQMHPIVIDQNAS